MRTGLFLTPGAARTAYQAGAVDVLVNEAGVAFDVIGGCSAGSVNAAFAATGQARLLVELWSRWRTRDILRPNWRGLLRGAIWWAPSLLDNRPQRRNAIDRIDSSAIPAGVRLRFNIANLDTGTDEVFEWPGAPLPLREGLDASVAVPGVAPPHAAMGTSWVDGLTFDGFPLEDVVLAAGVDRVFVVGVAPVTAAPWRSRNPFGVLQRALEWNQYNETRLGLEHAEEENRRAAAWKTVERSAHDVVERFAPPDQRAAWHGRLDELHTRAGAPTTRGPVEIIAILPEHETVMSFASYRPRRSAALIDEGRRDARRALANQTYA